MENSSEQLVHIKNSRSKLNLNLPDNYKELDSLEKRRAYQRAYCKSRYVSKANPDVRRGRPLGKRNAEHKPRLFDDKDYVREYNKKYYIANKDRIPSYTAEAQKEKGLLERQS